MEKGDRMELGVQRLNWTGQTIFKLIWVQSNLFVLWLRKGRREVIGLPATSYIILSLDGATFTAYKENNAEKVFAGNTDTSSIVQRSLSSAVKARFIRFYPVTYNRWSCFRVEIFVLK